MKCGFYEKEITPPLGGDIPGYYVHRLTTDVVDKLYVKAAVFAVDDAEPAKMVAMLTLDCCAVQEEFCKKVAARVEEFTGIPAAHVAVMANHTHRGFPTGGYGSDRDDSFMALLERLAADAAILAFQRLQPCSLSYGIGKEERPVFNRDYLMKDGCIATNTKYKDEIVRRYGGVDPDLPVLAVKDAEGNLMGALFTYALHQDTTGGNVYTGDYASHISYHLKAAYGQDFVSFFMIGCCGDINHVDDDFKGNFRSIGKMLAEDIIEIIDRSEAIADQEVRIAYGRLPLKRRRATEEMIRHAEWVCEDRKNRKDKYDMTGKAAPLLLEHIEATKDLPDDFDIPLQVMKLGEVFLYVMPFEVYHQFGEQLKAADPDRKWLISELSNFDGSYAPIEELFGTDAYPVQLCYGSWLEPKAGQKMTDMLIELAKTLD